MIYRLVLWLLILILSGIAAAHAQTAAVTARLDRAVIGPGETTHLIIETDGQIDVSGPDLTALEADFELLGQRNSTQVSIDNNGRHTTVQWLIELMPKRSGTIEIPPLTIGGKTTSPLTLEVRDLSAAAGSTGQDRDIFLEVSLEPDPVYVQAQTLFTVRVFYSVPLLEGSLGDPEPSAASIERLGDDISYQSQRNGRTYQVIERRFALFPEQSGTVTVPAIPFQGRIAYDRRNTQRFDRLFDRGRAIRLATEPMTLTVQPQPDEFTGPDWLPGREVTLLEQRDDDGSPITVGEPLTRTVLLEVKGQDGSQLPTPDLGLPDSVRVYPDQPTTANRSDGRWLTGTQEQRFAIVPTEPGELILPEIRVPWWDTVNDRQQVAVLPARIVQVRPAAVALKPDTSTTGIEPVPLTAAEPVSPTAGLWRWISAGLLVAWLLTLIGWWYDRRRQHGDHHPAVPPSHSVPQPRRTLAEACRRNQPDQAATAVLIWASEYWPQSPPDNLGQLAARWPEGAEALRALDRALFSSADEPWQGEALWQAVKQRPPHSVSVTVRPDVLPPLYPVRLSA